MIRIGSGEFRGRLLKTAPGLKTRPTQARLRAALWNSLQARIPGARLLELFAGSGALGLEALSRGAGEVVFIENDRRALAVLRENIALLGVGDRARVLPLTLHERDLGGLERSLSGTGAGGPFDLALADPPYEAGWERPLLDDVPWGGLLAPEGVFTLEWSPRKADLAELPAETEFLLKGREKNYGDSRLTSYSRKP